MGFLRKKAKSIQVYSPVSGSIKDISETPDPVFSQRMMGDGVVIFPSDQYIYAPVNGTVKVLFPTLHAIGIEVDGVELLIHIGVDTVNLKGKGFTSYIKVNDKIKVGDKLMKLDLEYIETHAPSTATMIVVTNGDGKTCKAIKMNEDVLAGDAIFEVVV